MKHEDLIRIANNALDRLYSDVSVSKGTTLADLQIIMDDLEIRCEALKNDIERNRNED